MTETEFKRLGRASYKKAIDWNRHAKAWSYGILFFVGFCLWANYLLSSPSEMALQGSRVQSDASFGYLNTQFTIDQGPNGLLKLDERGSITVPPGYLGVTRMYPRKITRGKESNVFNPIKALFFE